GHVPGAGRRPALPLPGRPARVHAAGTARCPGRRGGAAAGTRRLRPGSVDLPAAHARGPPVCGNLRGEWRTRFDPGAARGRFLALRLGATRAVPPEPACSAVVRTAAGRSGIAALLLRGCPRETRPAPGCGPLAAGAGRGRE